MQSIKERNEAAIKRMKQKFQDYLDSDSDMSVRDVFEFAKSLVVLSKEIDITPDDHNMICCHLLAKVDTEEDGIGEKPRYKLITKYNWALTNAVRDWNNRYEMGK